jgi:hypothetical protein
MNTFLILMLVSGFASAAGPSANKTIPAAKTEQVVKKEAIKPLPKILEEKEEDCDEKAKKPIEIKPESISLGGTTGCSLDDM